MNEAQFLAAIRANPVNAALLDRLPELHAPQVMLTAGCLFQTVWNLAAGRPPTEHILDYDVFYWDADLSFAAEDAVIRRAERLCADLNVRIEVRNQARVHLWYEQKFGVPGPVLADVRAGIDRFLIRCTCLGVAPDGKVYAPHGFDELERGVLRPNPANHLPALFRAKAESYRARWPWLHTEE